MNDRITKAYDDEIADLESQLAGIEKIKTRLAVVVRCRRAWIEANDPAIQDEFIEQLAGDNFRKREEIGKSFRGRRDSRNQAVYVAVERFLATANGPVATTTLLKLVTELGIEIGGKNPQNTLSAMLSTSRDFESQGRAGWTLKNSGDAAQKNEAAGTPSKDAPTASAQEQPHDGVFG